ncbi:MAG: TonB-dependent receptor, partial [Marinilabiliaceae bacterium]|nr:TonB-dependent receptor [Marinilabiliaceae bacterium]
KGMVTDDKGEPLPGVNVFDKQQPSNGVITGIDGNYTIQVSSSDAVLTYSFIGFETQEVQVAGRSKIDITLVEEMTGLDEVVVVGYGTKKKVNLTGAVASVDNKMLENRPSENILKSLQGVVPGVTIISRPGSTSINIRGRGNLGESSPLYIVDGIEVSSDFFSNLDPNSIDNLTFLKDASSAAIYGAKAAYGVVLVTTKGGQRDILKVDYNGSFGMQTPTYIPEVLDSWKYADMYRISELNSGIQADGLRFSEEDVQNYKNGSDADLYPNTNWFDEVLRDQALFTKHSLQFSGGSEKVQYNFGLGYLKDETLTPGEGTDRYNFSAKTKADLKSWLSVTANMNFIYKKYDREKGPASLTEFLRVPPTQVVRHTNGEWGSVRNGRQATAAEINYNPLRTLEEKGRKSQDTRHLMGSISAVLKPFKGLEFTNQLGYRYWDQRKFEFQNKKDGVPSYLNPSTGIIPGTASEVNQMDQDWRYSEKLIYDGWINYSKTFNDVHNFDAMVGMHADSYISKVIRVGRKNFASNDMNALSGGSTDPEDQLVTNEVDPDDYRPLGYDYQEESTQSYFGRVTYNYNQKYLFEANLRADASSRFAKDGRWGYFPSFSGGWRVSEEQFMTNMDWLDNLKLRASWGKNGNINNIGLYDTYSTYAAGGTSYLGGQVVSILNEDRIANPDLTWETTTTTDIGLDLMIKNGLFGLTFDYYNRLTDDILIRANDVAIETGISSSSIPARNVGQVRNSGIELALTHQQHLGDFSYFVGFNMANNINEVIDLGDKVTQLPPKDYWIYQVGESIGSFYMFEADGLYSTQDIEAGNVIPYGTQVPEAGMVKFVDQNNDKVIDDKDRTIVGQDVPDFTYGININLNYKNWSLSAIGQGVTGVKVYMDNEASQAFFNSAVPREWQLDHWTESNQNANYPKLFKETDARYAYNSITSSYWLFNGDYFRMKNITLSYNLPKHITQKAGLEKVRLYVSGDNMFTIRGDKRMKDFDPERSSGRGAQIGLKTYTAGVSLTF